MFDSDYGGEFNNNGMVVRNNGILYETMMKTKEDAKCNMETALAWEVCAKRFSIKHIWIWSKSTFLEEKCEYPVSIN